MLDGGYTGEDGDSRRKLDVTTVSGVLPIVSTTLGSMDSHGVVLGVMLVISQRIKCVFAAMPNTLSADFMCANICPFLIARGC